MGVCLFTSLATMVNNTFVFSYPNVQQKRLEAEARPHRPDFRCSFRHRIHHLRGLGRQDPRQYLLGCLLLEK